MIIGLVRLNLLNESDTSVALRSQLTAANITPHGGKKKTTSPASCAA